MSRIGNKAIPVPSGITIDINGSIVKVTGPKGSLLRTIRSEVALVKEGDTLLVKSDDLSKRVNAFRGLTRSLINNMIIGATKGFERKLIVEGVGYRANVTGKKLTLSVGFSNQVDFTLPEGVSATVDQNKITLGAIDKELLGLTEARIREIRKPEPYKGKGIRYEDEYIVRKVGKSAGKK